MKKFSYYYLFIVMVIAGLACLFASVALPLERNVSAGTITFVTDEEVKTFSSRSGFIRDHDQWHAVWSDEKDANPGEHFIISIAKNIRKGDVFKKDSLKKISVTYTGKQGESAQSYNMAKDNFVLRIDKWEGRNGMAIGTFSGYLHNAGNHGQTMYVSGKFGIQIKE